MNCAELHNLLGDALDGQLSEIERTGLEAHLDNCAKCRQLVAREQSLREALNMLPVEPASNGFAARALRHAAEVNGSATRHKTSFVAGFATAAVAALVFLFVGVIYNQDTDDSVATTQTAGNSSPPTIADSRSPAAEITIGLHKTQRVKLTFNSSQAVQHVRISLTLPEDVDLEGYPGKRQIAWYTDLEQGENVLTLPFMANSLQGGEFIARIEHGSTVNELRLKVNVGKPGISALDVLRKA